MIESLPEELLEQARVLLSLPHTQANLRRSTAVCYYALFHLLIRDASALWSVAVHRHNLARQFDHKPMREASTRFVQGLSKQIAELKPDSVDFETLNSLLFVIDAFARLQQRRLDADYNLAVLLTYESAHATYVTTTTAFGYWNTVKGGPRALDYLYSLLFKDRA
jgi:hypothetical protein